jgi:hypothetical protein
MQSFTLTEKNSHLEIFNDKEVLALRPQLREQRVSLDDDCAVPL